MRLVLVRLSDEGDHTLGRLYAFDGLKPALSLVTLEPAWVNNERNISCIPWGRYTIRKRTSAKFGEHFHVVDVQNRSWILIHKGNYAKDTEGCILIGMSIADINGDGALDIYNSSAAMALLLNTIEGQATLDIVGALP